MFGRNPKKTKAFNQKFFVIIPKTWAFQQFSCGVGTGTEVVVILAELTVDTETRCSLEEMMREASFKLVFLGQ